MIIDNRIHLQADSITVSSRQVDTIENVHRYSLSATLFRPIVLGSFAKCIHIDYKSTERENINSLDRTRDTDISRRNDRTRVTLHRVTARLRFYAGRWWIGMTRWRIIRGGYCVCHHVQKFVCFKDLYVIIIILFTSIKRIIKYHSDNE